MSETEGLLPAVVMAPEGPPRASVIWLHGLGADGHDFEPIVPELGLRNASVRFVFPHAPMRSVTINGGAVMRAWYDIRSLDLERDVPREHLDQSRARVNAWIANERALGVPSEKIVLAGFSQGGAVALYTGLPHPERLAGVIALSCYHPAPSLIQAQSSGANRGLSVFMGHGAIDPLVPLELAKQSAGELDRSGYAVEWHAYERLPHGVSAEEVQDIRTWLRSALAR